MAQSLAKTVDEYLMELPSERQKTISKLRNIVLENLPKGYRETMNWGMIAYEVPLEIYPNTYNEQPLLYAALASQKNHMALYLQNIYGDKEIEKWFFSEYKKSGKRMNIGKSCVRFRKIEDLPLDLIDKTIARTPLKSFIEICESSRR